LLSGQEHGRTSPLADIGFISLWRYAGSIFFSDLCLSRPGDGDRVKLRKLRSSALADATVHVERDGGARSAGAHAVDPGTRSASADHMTGTVGFIVASAPVLLSLHPR